MCSDQNESRESYEVQSMFSSHMKKNENESAYLYAAFAANIGNDQQGTLRRSLKSYTIFPPFFSFRARSRRGNHGPIKDVCLYRHQCLLRKAPLVHIWAQFTGTNYGAPIRRSHRNTNRCILFLPEVSDENPQIYSYLHRFVCSALHCKIISAFRVVQSGLSVESISLLPFKRIWAFSHTEWSALSWRISRTIWGRACFWFHYNCTVGSSSYWHLRPDDLL